MLFGKLDVDSVSDDDNGGDGGGGGGGGGISDEDAVQPTPLNGKRNGPSEKTSTAHDRVTRIVGASPPFKGRAITLDEYATYSTMSDAKQQQILYTNDNKNAQLERRRRVWTNTEAATTAAAVIVVAAAVETRRRRRLRRRRPVWWGTRQYQNNADTDATLWRTVAGGTPRFGRRACVRATVRVCVRWCVRARV